MKRIIVKAITVIGIVSALSGAGALAVSIDTSGANSGFITVEYDKSLSTKVKTIISKDGVQYTYDIQSAETELPLQLGSGTYSVSVHENISGTTYNTVASTNVTASGLSDAEVYTNSIQMVNYEAYASVISEIDAQMANAATIEEKVQIAKNYTYVITNYSYDKAKAASVQSGYVPNLSDFYSTKSGICYDYSSLFAAIMRSHGVPTKLIMGYSNTASTYHAWNQVMIDGSWVTVDTTYDSQLAAAGRETTMEKDSSGFQIVKEY